MVVRRGSGRGQRRGAQSSIQTCVDECSVSLAIEFWSLERVARWLGKRGFNRGGLVDMAQFGAFGIRFNSDRKKYVFCRCFVLVPQWVAIGIEVTLNDLIDFQHGTSFTFH